MKVILAWLLVIWFVLFMFLPIGLNCYFFVNLIDGITIFGAHVGKLIWCTWGFIVCMTVGLNLLGS